MGETITKIFKYEGFSMAMKNNQMVNPINLTFGDGLYHPLIVNAVYHITVVLLPFLLRHFIWL